MKVLIPGALRSYTERSDTEAAGATLSAVLTDLERQYPGIRFRMMDAQGELRRDVRSLVIDDKVHELAHPLDARDEVVIAQPLSGS